MVKASEIEAAVDDLAGDPPPEQMTLADVDGLLAGLAAPVKRRGRGRPPGARNRRTTDMLEYLERSGYAPPMLRLARIAAADTKTLATSLRCRIAEAFDRQQAALIALLPYWHQKLPIAAEIEAKGALAVYVGQPPAGGSDAGGGSAPVQLLGEAIARAIGLGTEENEADQGVTVIDGTPVGTDELEDDAKRVDL
jgi:hypothetical protein